MLLQTTEYFRLSPLASALDALVFRQHFPSIARFRLRSNRGFGGELTTEIDPKIDTVRCSGEGQVVWLASVSLWKSIQGAISQNEYAGAVSEAILVAFALTIQKDRHCSHRPRARAGKSIVNRR